MIRVLEEVEKTTWKTRCTQCSALLEYDKSEVYETHVKQNFLINEYWIMKVDCPVCKTPLQIGIHHGS